MTEHGLAEDHLICPIGVPTRIRTGHAGQELAPASTAMVERLLWRRRARPSATLDKMRTKLEWRNCIRETRPASSENRRAGPDSRKPGTRLARHGPADRHVRSV